MLCQGELANGFQPSQQLSRLKWGRGAHTSRSVFRFEPGLVSSNSKRAVVILDFWLVWGVHVPRIWIGSIDPREITVKQK
jgi:hypothetical protein